MCPVKGQTEMCPVERSNWNVSSKKVKLHEMYPVKKSNWNVSGKKVKLKCVR